MQKDATPLRTDGCARLIQKYDDIGGFTIMNAAHWLIGPCFSQYLPVKIYHLKTD